MEIHFAFAILSSILSIACFFPYIRDIFKGTTKPHSFTWLIWTILQTVGVAAMAKAGAGIGTIFLIVGVMLCGTIFLLSLRFGTHNINRFDIGCLVGALSALAAYFLVDNPLVSVMIVALTDFIGFLPTMRKAYEEPHTETALTYVLSSISSVLALGALSSFSVASSLYLVSLVLTNGICATVILLRRKSRV
jgi:hypothetical protein